MSGIKGIKWIKGRKRRIMRTELTSKELNLNKEQRIIDLGKTSIKELDELTKEKRLELNVEDYYEELEII